MTLPSKVIILFIYLDFVFVLGARFFRADYNTPRADRWTSKKDEKKNVNADTIVACSTWNMCGDYQYRFDYNLNESQCRCCRQIGAQYACSHAMTVDRCCHRLPHVSQRECAVHAHWHGCLCPSVTHANSLLLLYEKEMCRFISGCAACRVADTTRTNNKRCKMSFVSLWMKVFRMKNWCTSPIRKA